MVGVDPSTILAWEKGKGRVSERLKVLLASYEFNINHQEVETLE